MLHKRLHVPIMAITKSTIVGPLWRQHTLLYVCCQNLKRAFYAFKQVNYLHGEWKEAAPVKKFAQLIALKFLIAHDSDIQCSC